MGLETWNKVITGQSGQCAIETAGDFRLGLHAYDAINLAAGPEDQQRGDTANLKAGGGSWILVDVELGYAHLSRHFSCELLQYRGDHLARATPWRPHIEQHGQRRAFHLRGKGSVCHLDWFSADG